MRLLFTMAIHSSFDMWWTRTARITARRSVFTPTSIDSIAAPGTLRCKCIPTQLAPFAFLAMLTVDYLQLGRQRRWGLQCGG
jgi:hypothetical protein